MISVISLCKSSFISFFYEGKELLVICISILSDLSNIPWILFNCFSKRTKGVLQLSVFHKTKVVKFRKGGAYSNKKSPRLTIPH